MREGYVVRKPDGSIGRLWETISDASFLGTPDCPHKDHLNCWPYWEDKGYQIFKAKVVIKERVL